MASELVPARSVPGVRKPAASICMPVYNAGGVLRAAVESVLDQTFRDFEFIIVDNHSDDGSYEVLSSYKDPRMRLFRNPETVPSETNARWVTELANGEYVAICHGDDVYEPEMVEHEVRYLDRVHEAAAVFAAARLIDANGRIVGDHPMPRRFLMEEGWARSYDFWTIFRQMLVDYNFLLCSGAMMRRQAYRRVARRWTSELFGESADLAIWLGILEGSRIGILPRRLMKWRRTPMQHTARLLRA